MAGIVFDKVRFQYPAASRPALDNLSFDFPFGEFVGIIGAGNAGKSTLCAALAGIVPQLYHGQMQGEVRIDNLPVSRMETWELTGRVGLVLQIPVHQLSGTRFTVFEETAFALENLGIERDEIIARVKQALEETGLEPFARQNPYTLSGGQQQRLAIASALAMDPDILVLDEPTTFLDPLATQKIFALLSRLNQQGKTIVIAEHRLEWIAEYATDVVALKQGTIAAHGPPEKVLTHPVIRETGLDWTGHDIPKPPPLQRPREYGLQNNPFPLDLPWRQRDFSCHEYTGPVHTYKGFIIQLSRRQFCAETYQP